MRSLSLARSFRRMKILAFWSWTRRRRESRPSGASDGLGRIYGARRGRILEMKEAPLEGALCLNPRTLSPRCKRVLARYLSVESQAGRVAGGRGRGRGLKGIGEGPRPGRRECNLQIRVGGGGGGRGGAARRIPAASLTLSRQRRSQSEIEISGREAS